MAKPWEKYQSQSEQSVASTGPWNKYEPKEVDSKRPSLLSQAGSVAGKGLLYAGEKIDQVTGAPARAGLGYLSGMDVSNYDFLGDPDKAPSGQQIAKQWGVPDKESETNSVSYYGGRPQTTKANPSKLVGTAIDFLADPTLAVTGSLKAGIKGTQKAAGFLGKGLKTGAKKAVSAATSVPVKQMETYFKRFDRVEDLIKKYGDDIEGMADDVRRNFKGQIDTFRRGANKEIGQALDTLSPQKVHPVNGIVEKLNQVKSQVDLDLNPKAGAELDDLISRIMSKADESGRVSGRDLFNIKEHLQDVAKGAYVKDGQIFTGAKDISRASKNAASVARKELNKISPEIAEANNKLAKLHMIERRMNKNLIAEGKPSNSLFTAGAGTHMRNEKNLGLLEDITGQPFLQQAEEFSAAKEFANPSFVPRDFTGKAASRQIFAGGVGGLLGGQTMGVVAALAANPATLKAAIKTDRLLKRAVDNTFGKVVPYEKVSELLRRPENQEALVRTLRFMETQSKDGLIVPPAAEREEYNYAGT